MTELKETTDFGWPSLYWWRMFDENKLCSAPCLGTEQSGSGVPLYRQPPHCTTVLETLAHARTHALTRTHTKIPV